VRTVQMTLDEELVKEVDEMAARQGTTRSAFTRDALRAALDRAREADMEKRHRVGYERQPLTPEETAGWDEAQAWDDDDWRV
jgi:metal-responsive CopG/Arc/MetJ family transcriptional regulator